MGQNPGDSTSDRETAPRRQGKKLGIYVIFGEWKIHAIKNIFFFQKVSTRLVKPLLVMRNSVTLEKFSALLDTRRYKDWAHKTSS